MLEIKNVSHSYKLSNKSTTNILCDLNFNLPSKGIVFITGKSGCGKTTLLNILEGILKPTKGEIIFDGVDIYNDKKFNFSLYNGVLFQNYNLIDNLTVYQNLKIAADLKNVDYKVIDEKLKQYDMMNLKDSLVDNLSGGEKQRIAFIRSIINSPEVIFCDEPTGAIDESNAKILMEDLRKLSENSLVIVVTHNKDLILKDDYVVELKEGKAMQNINLMHENPVKTIPNDKKIKHRTKYLSTLSTRLFSKSTFKHVLYMASLFASILFIELTLGLSFGINNQRNNLEFSYLNNNRFTISEREKRVETGSPISLVKEVRPQKDMVKRNLEVFKDVEIYNNYSYFLSGKNVCFSGSQEIKDFKVELSFNLQSGVKINSLFYDLLEDKKAKISLELNQNYTYKKVKNEEVFQNFDERFYYSSFFEPNDIVKEFSYLNTPTIYLPLNEFELYLKETKLDKVFKESREVISWFEAVENAKNDDPISSYSYDFYLDDKEQTKICYALIDSLGEDDVVKIMNEPHFYVSSFLSIADILTLGLNVFCILSIIITFCLLFFVVISLYMQERKEIALLKVLGSKADEINSIFNNTIIVETIFSFILATLSGTLLSKFLNNIVTKNLGIKSVISIPNFTTNLTQLLFIFLALFLSILIVILTNYLAIKNATKKSVALELREE